MLVVGRWVVLQCCRLLCGERPYVDGVGGRVVWMVGSWVVLQSCRLLCGEGPYGV